MRNTMAVKFVRLIMLILLLTPAIVLAAKPASSFSLEMQWTAPVLKGGINEFKVIVRSSMAAQSLQIKLSLPPNVVLVEGESASDISLAQGKSLDIFYKVLVPENASGSISAVVSQGKPGQAYFAAGNDLLIDTEETQSLKARSRNTTPYNKTVRDGVGIREYQLTK